MKNSKKEYLEKMGITQWYQRDAKKPAAYFCVRLYSSTQRLTGYLIAVVDQTVSVDDQRTLLEKIAHAISKHADCDMIPELILDEKADFLAIFGDLAISYPAQKIHRVHSLKQLLMHPENKKETWNKLKPFCELFHDQ